MTRIHKLIRSKRKTLSLEVNEKAEVIVRAPLKLSDSLIQSFISEKNTWIREKISEAERRKAPEKTYIEGETFLYLGRVYSLCYKQGVKGLLFEDKFYISPKNVDKAQKLFQNWYRERAGLIVLNQVEYYAGLKNLEFGRLKISSAKKRWGSCSGKNNLNFSWRLILAPLEILDYVVVHELAHILHKNHSQLFWKYVGEIIPDYKKRRKWLREKGHTLSI